MDTETSKDPSSWLLKVPAAERSGPGIPDVGGLFRTYRRVHRMTQAGLASFLGLDQSYVSKIEKGDRQVRDVKVLQWIGNRLGVPLEDLGLSSGPYPVANPAADTERAARERRVQDSQRQWRVVRRSLNQRRLELTRIAAKLYEDRDRIPGTALITQPDWLPPAPVDLADIQLMFASPPATDEFVTGAEPATEAVRPLGAQGGAYTRYTRAIRDCDRPALFENRLGYRLLDVSWDPPSRRTRGRLSFGHTTYFDMLDVCEAAAHELAALQFLREKGRFHAGGKLGSDGAAALSMADLPFRRLVGCPFDLARRSLLPSINTITLRRSRTSASFILHWRDPVQVAVAGGMFHVMPAGVFQPSSIAPEAQVQDFDLWRNVMREFSEEFLGNPDHDGSSGELVDYEHAEPFKSLNRARLAGELRVMCLGIGVDPLTLAGEILTVAVIDDHVFDRIFDGLVPANTEGTIVAAPNRKLAEGVPFTGANVERLLGSGLMAPAAAACLQLAWQNRHLLLGGTPGQVMRVLVTGAAGYIGRAVVFRLAAAGHEVTALTSAPPANSVRFPPGTTTVVADVRDRERLDTVLSGRRYDGVCHLAARTRVRESLIDPMPYYEVNLHGTVNLLAALERAALAAGVPARLVFASTGAVYGPEQAQPIGEDAVPAPANPYASSKLSAERAISFRVRAGVLGAVSLRCFNAAGATVEVGDTDASRLIPKALAVAEGRAPCLEVNGDGSVVRELTHVADLADAYALALQATRPGCHDVFNVGSGVGVTVNDVISAVEEVTGHELPVRSRPAQNEPKELVADSSRLRARIRWQPERSTLHRIVGDAWQWQLSHPR